MKDAELWRRRDLRILVACTPVKAGAVVYLSVTNASRRSNLGVLT